MHINTLCTAALSAASFGSLASAVTFYPKINMTDTNGDAIQAHGGAILRSADSGDSNWYWFGEDKTEDRNTFQGVNCYRSADMSAWERVGHVLDPVEGTGISSDRVVERPKVIYNDKNEEYVMWFHADSSNYGAAEVGVATSKTVDGQYEWKANWKPFSNDSRDMTVWKDEEDGSAYLIFATSNNADFEIAKLNDEYYNHSVPLFTFEDKYWEAPGVFKIDGLFYVLFSRQDGWTPTDNFYVTSDSMAGPWSDLVDLAPEGSYAYLTQNAYDIVINGSEETTYLYLGDHWSGNYLSSSTYSLLPVEFDGTKLTLHDTAAWTLDIESGTWEDLAFDRVTAAESDTAEATLVSCDDGCEGGLAANMTGGSNFTFTYTGESGDKVLSIEYVYSGPKNSLLHIAVEVNGAVQPGNALLETTRGTTVGQEAPFPVAGLSEGDEVTLTLLDFDGNAFWVSGVKVYEDLR